MIPGLNDYEQKFQVFSEPIIKPGLTAMELALERLGNPHKNLRVVHLAGTNGKGSTLTYVEAIARQHGLKTGAFLSPAIETVHDQLRINGQAVSEAQMDSVFIRLQQAQISSMCTEFELLTCAAFVLFELEKVDVAIIEAGLGGRFDSTNVVTPIVSIITSIALEHTNFLGSTIASIAHHKAGIIKANTTAVIGTVNEEAFAVIEAEAKKVGAELDIFGQAFQLEGDAYRDETFYIEALRPGMLGQHQLHNAVLAIRAMTHIITLEPQLVTVAIRTASLPFRFERVTHSLYFDGAHNPASAEKLVATITDHFPNKRVHFIVGMLADKDVQQVLSIFETISDHFVFVDFDNERAMSAEQLLSISHANFKRIETEPVPYVVHCAQQQQHITVVTGSLYLLASLRAKVLTHLI